MGVPLKNPYVGPRTFEEDHKEFFFGRDNEARQLLSMVISERLVLFYSQSGAGKSSLINTRLRPGLYEEGFTVLPTARVGGALPEGVSDVDNIFMFNLIASLNPTDDDPGHFTQTTLHHYLQSLKDATPTTDEYGQEKAWVLIIDQFEEIVTTNLERWQDRQEFFQQLAEALRADPLLWVVLTMREDHIAAIEAYARYLPWGIRRRFNMQRMTAAAALKAITEPAQKGGRPFIDAAAQRLVDNLRQLRTAEEVGEAPLGEFIEPVQLQVVCYQLWENLNAQPAPPEMITEKDLQAFGDVDAALAQFYETAIRHVLHQTHESELALRRWFEEKLITEAGTRGTVYRGTETTEGMSNETVRLLADQYLLRAEPRAGGLWYELVHDRFVAPILQANQQWRLRQNPLMQAAELWLRSQRRRDLLYKDEQLSSTLESVKWEMLEPSVQEFLTACQEAQSQRDLEQAQQLAEEQARRAEAEAQTARRLRFLTVALAAAILVAIWFAFTATRERDTAVKARSTAEASEGIAIFQQNQAELSEVAAVKARQTAEANATVAITNADLAATREVEAIANANLAATRQAELLASQAEAERLRQIGLAQSLSLQANDQLAQDNTELAALLALEALQLNEDKNTDLVTRIMTDWHFNIGLSGHNHAITALAFGAATNVLASADDAGTIFLWQLAAPGTLPTLLPRQGNGIRALQFSPDGHTLATADDNGRLQLWTTPTIETDLQEPTLLGHQGAAVLALEFDHSGNLLAAGTTEGIIYVWDTRTAVSETISLDQAGPINTLTFSPDGQKVAVTAGNEIQIWQVNQPTAPLMRWEKEGVTLQTAVFSLDGSLLAAGGSGASGKNGELYIWPISGFETTLTTEPLSLSIHRTSVMALAFDPSGQFLASASSDGQILLWNKLSIADAFRYSSNVSEIPGGDFLIDQFSSQAGSPQTINFSHDGQNLAIGHDNGKIQLWQLIPEDPTIALRDGFAEVWAFAFSPDGKMMASVSADQGIRLWLAEDFLAFNQPPPFYLSPPLPEYPAGFNPFAGNAITFSPTGLLASVDFSSGIYLWSPSQLSDLSRAIPIPAAFEAHLDQVKSIAFHGDPLLLATGGNDSAIAVWDVVDLASPDLLQKVTAHDAVISNLAFSPDGQWLASADQIGTLLLWDVAHLLAEGEATATLPGHEAWINSLDFSPDGQWLASGSDDTLLKIWDLSEVAAASYLSPTILVAHTTNVNAVKFSPDGTLLASADFYGRVLLWDTANFSQPLREFYINDGQVWSLAFTPDGQVLAASSERGAIHFLPLGDPVEENFMATACRRLSRNLTMDEWHTYLPGEGDYRLTCPENLPDPLYIQSLLTSGDDINESIKTLQALTGENTAQILVLAITNLVENRLIDQNEALTLLQHLVEIYPDNAQLAYPLAVLGLQYLYIVADDPEGIALLEQALALDPAVIHKLPANHLDAYTILTLCSMSITRRDTEETPLFCAQALAIPVARLTTFDGWYYLEACGNALATEQLSLAETLCQRAFVLDPTLAADYYALRTLRDGLIKAMQAPIDTGNYEAALTAAEELATILPGSSLAWRANLATVYTVICRQVDTAVDNPVVRSACEQASALALAWGETFLNTEVCLSVGHTPAGDLVQANCEAALETAVSEANTIRYLFPLCALAESPSLSQFGQAACDAVDEASVLAGKIELNQPVYGSVEPYLGEYWLFTGQAGQIITIRLDKYQSELDALVTVFAPDGQFVDEDDESGEEHNALLSNLTLPKSGVYIIFAHGWDDSSGGYKLEIVPAGE